MGARHKDLEVKAEDLFQASGATFVAKRDVLLDSGGKFTLDAQETESDVSASGRRFSYHRFSLENHKTQIESGRHVDLHSDQGMLFAGLDITAKGNIKAKSETTLETRVVQDVFEEQTQSSSKGNAFKGKSKTSTQKFSSTAVRDVFNSGGDVTLESEGDNRQQAPSITSEGSVTITSNEGKVYLDSAKSTQSFSQQKSSSSAVWQSQTDKGTIDEQVEIAHIQAKGGFHVSAAQGVEIDVKSYGGLEKTLDHLASNPETAWIKDLRDNPDVNWRLVAEEHKKWSKKVEGLTPAASAIIGLAVAVATAGSGAAAGFAGLVGCAKGGLAATMTAAGFTSLVSQASVSLVSNKGNIGKTLKDLGSQQAIQFIATAVVSAGLVYGVSDALNLPMSVTDAQTFTQHLQVNAVRAAVGGGLSMAVDQQKPGII